MKKAILIVMDSMGIGELSDASEFGDVGANTLGNIISKMNGINIPNLRSLGIGNIDGVSFSRYNEELPIGSYGKLKELSKGKDTITGHWEMMGIETKTPFKTYPNGFPKEFMDIFEDKIGVECLGNYPTSGTEVIDKLGPLHEATGKPIVYTSADSVFQIAANIDVIPLERLYEICEIARDLLVGEFACGRVIARPYKMIDGERVRTSDRHDYAVSPPVETLLDKIKKAGMTTYAVGKISDIFNGTGIVKAVHTTSNMDGVDKTLEAMNEDFDGLIFTNLVDFDSLYGHRRDVQGYGKAIEEFDERLPEIINKMGYEDLLIICADHGNDPTHEGFDHTREHVPVLIYGKTFKAGVNLGVGNSFANIGMTIADYLNVDKLAIGESFLDQIIE